jgi:hypothetical protein
MMYQMFEMASPIPSCQIHELRWNPKASKWSYIYAVSTPKMITEENNDDMIIYEFVCDLDVRLASGLTDDSVNIHFKRLSEYVDLLNKQREADVMYRKKWVAMHPDAKPYSIKLECKNYSYADLKRLGVLYIASFEYNSMDIVDGKPKQFAIFTGAQQ